MAFTVPVGSVIAGKYRVERILGQGGMGVVVAARHLDLGERVAIKFPAADPSHRPAIAARLLREGRAAMQLRSEHVARVYDIGTLPTKEPYLVMEYLVGRDLGDVLADGGPLSIDTAVEYLLQAIEAIAEAHSRGIVHRDLKPSNLFLTDRADGSALVKVIDFGISKVKASLHEANLTGPVGALGTPLYMAPEQMLSARAVDARSDIWSLGATCYALLTGVPPFLGATLVDIHEGIVRGAPRVRAARPEAPEALEVILLRCLRRLPEERFADVAELALALAEVAPDHARVSAERAARTLQRVPPAAYDLEAPGAVGVMSATRGTASPTEPPADASSVLGERPAPTGGSQGGLSRRLATTEGARPGSARRRAILLASVSVAATAAGALAVFAGFHVVQRGRTSGPSPAAVTTLPPSAPSMALPATFPAAVPSTSGTAVLAALPPLSSAPAPSSSASATRKAGASERPGKRPAARVVSAPLTSGGMPTARAPEVVPPSVKAPTAPIPHDPFFDPD